MKSENVIMQMSWIFFFEMELIYSCDQMIIIRLNLMEKITTHLNKCSLLIIIFMLKYCIIWVYQFLPSGHDSLIAYPYLSIISWLHCGAHAESRTVSVWAWAEWVGTQLSEHLFAIAAMCHAVALWTWTRPLDHYSTNINNLVPSNSFNQFNIFIAKKNTYYYSTLRLICGKKSICI